jgi:methylenetetrahydrofolate dehydrogenase (NADP+) / methenyltetrahydrofolate cyclohydrolase
MWLNMPGFGSCTPAGIMTLLRHYNVTLEGAQAVVIGRSPILGKPMAAMLTRAHATVTICHSRTRELADVVRRADVLVAAVGRPKFVQGDWVKPGAVVIDAGYNPGNVGDVDFERRRRARLAHHPRPRRRRPHDHRHPHRPDRPIRRTHPRLTPTHPHPIPPHPRPAVNPLSPAA